MNSVVGVRLLNEREPLLSEAFTSRVVVSALAASA